MRASTRKAEQGACLGVWQSARRVSRARTLGDGWAYETAGLAQPFRTRDERIPGENDKKHVSFERLMGEYAGMHTAGLEGPEASPGP